MVIGCSGAGKSTFSRKLRDLLSLPLIHLDQYYWQPNWTETESEQWHKTVSKLAIQENWVIDGNYGGTLDMRLDRADTIIYLDYPAWLCLIRVIRRVLFYWGRVRPDMPQGCAERFSGSFLWYVATYNYKKKPKLLKKLRQLPAEKQVIILKNDHQGQELLRRIKKKLPPQTKERFPVSN